MADNNFLTTENMAGDDINIWRNTYSKFVLRCHTPVEHKV